jgi:hypothetical protein
VRVLFFEPGKPPELRDIGSSLEAVRDAIGGWIDLIRLEKDVALVCDDEGIPKGLAPNLYAVGPIYRGAFIHGPCFVSGYRMDHDGGDLADLSPKAAELYARLPRAEHIGGMR